MELRQDDLQRTACHLEDLQSTRLNICYESNYIILHQNSINMQDWQTRICINETDSVADMHTNMVLIFKIQYVILQIIILTSKFIGS